MIWFLLIQLIACFEEQYIASTEDGTYPEL